MSKITLTTRKPLVRALGIGGRIKREMAQPMYLLNGQLVAHMKRKFRAVRIVDATTVECDLLAPAVAEMAPEFGRLDVNEAITALGGKPFAPAAAKKTAPAKAKATKAAKAPARTAEGGDSLSEVVAAIMRSDASEAEKTTVINALLAKA